MPELVLFSDKGIQTYKFSGTPTVSEVLFVNGWKVSGTCGGTSLCGKCLVMADGALSEPDDAEKKFIKPGCRLACRTHLIGNATVIADKLEKVSSTSSFAKVKKQNEKSAEESQKGIGAAVDIGTGVIKLALYDMKTQKQLTLISCANPLIAYGADDESRIAASVNGARRDLCRILTNAVADLLVKAANDAGVRQSRINSGVISGSVASLYFIHGYKANELYYEISPDVRVFTKHLVINGTEFVLPCPINHRIGSDMTSALIESDLLSRKEISLLCDIGARGQLALKVNRKLFVNVTGTLPYAKYISGSDFSGDISDADAKKINSALSDALKELTKSAGIGMANIEKIYLSGGLAKAQNILPDAIKGNITFIDNAALKGEAKILFDDTIRRTIKKSVRAALAAK